MFGILRRLSIPKLSTGILRWTFYSSRFMGEIGFKLKSTSNDRVMMEDSSLMWKWCFAIIRIGCFTIFVYMYVEWEPPYIDLTERFMHFIRVLLHLACYLSILRLQLCQGQEVTHLVNSFLQLFRKVQAICGRNRNGFGGKNELIVLLFILVSCINEAFMLVKIFRPYWNLHEFLCWLAETHIAFGSKMLLYLPCLWYLSLGVLYRDLNDFVGSQLETLDLQTTNGKLRRIRKSLNKCLDCYRDLHSLTSKFQNVYDFPLFFGLGANCLGVLLFAYIVIIAQRYNIIMLYSKTVIEVLNMFLLTWSVQRAVIKSAEIRLLMLNNCNLGKIQNWNKTSEMFSLQLSVDEFRLRPLGLFIVSKELFLTFLSAMVSYFTFFIQCRMQLK